MRILLVNLLFLILLFLICISESNLSISKAMHTWCTYLLLFWISLIVGMVAKLVTWPAAVTGGSFSSSSSSSISELTIWCLDSSSDPSSWTWAEGIPEIVLSIDILFDFFDLQHFLCFPNWSFSSSSFASFSNSKFFINIV